MKSCAQRSTATLQHSLPLRTTVWVYHTGASGAEVRPSVNRPYFYVGKKVRPAVNAFYRIFLHFMKEFDSCVIPYNSLWYRLVLMLVWCSSWGDVSLLFSLIFSWSRFFLAFLISLLVCLLFFWCGCCIVVLLLDALLLSCLAHLAFLSCFWCVGSSSWLFVSSSRFFFAWLGCFCWFVWCLFRMFDILFVLFRCCCV